MVKRSEPFGECVLAVTQRPAEPPDHRAPRCLTTILVHNGYHAMSKSMAQMRTVESAHQPRGAVKDEGSDSEEAIPRNRVQRICGDEAIWGRVGTKGRKGREAMG